jgi:phage terminase small subunit
MGKIDPWSQIKKDNANMNEAVLRVYFDALGTYLEASKNVRVNGAIVAHPKTGAPIENPYLKVQQSCGKTIAYYAKINSVKTTELIIETQNQEHI